MEHFLAIFHFAFGTLALYFCVRISRSKEKKYLENRLFSVFCLASAIWSFGYGEMILQNDAEMAYICRGVGLIGIFLYLIIAQTSVCRLSGMKRIWCYLLEGIAYCGIIIFFIAMKKGEVVYYLSDWGMTFHFKLGASGIIYTVYTIIIAITIFIGIMYMILRSKAKRIRMFGKLFLIAEVIVVVGMIFDTIFPMLGKASIPGSSLTQFLGLAVLQYAVHFLDNSRINVANMSEYIYYSLAMPVLVYDSDRKLQILNDAAYSFLGIERDQENLTNLKIEYLFSIQEEEVFEFEGKHLDMDAVCRKNQIYCSLAVSEIDDTFGDPMGYIILVTDLSERMKTVAELEEAIRTAEAANKAKTTFLANMSHEIRTPMHAIIGFSELVLKMDIDDEVREYVEDIKWSSHNLLAIINDILDISKIESGKMEVVNGEYYIASLLNDVSLIISAQAKEKGLDFVMNVDSSIPGKLHGDKIRIRGVLINLLNNAVKYTKEGRVTFDVGVAEIDEKSVTLEFRISDTGVGIKESELPNVFKSFERMDRKVHYGVEGSGLGLAIVKGYVELMGGEVRAESVYGEGSVFTAIIRQDILDQKPIGESYAESDRQYGGNSMSNIRIVNTRILVVDDNLVNLKVASKTLGYYGLAVDTASSGMAAIELCQENRYQMVFMDQMMPEMDGIEAMRRIRELDSYYDYGGESKIIVLTADSVSGVRVNLMDAGFDEYLGKPMNFKQLERLFVRFLPEENIQMVEDGDNRQPEEDSRENTERNYIKEELADADVDMGIANCGGTVEDYLKILQIAYQYGAKQLAELQELLEQQDYKNYTIKIHSVKSSTLNMGAVQISELAKQLEAAGLNQDYTYIDSHMGEFETGYSRLLEKIEQILKHYQMLEDTEEEDKPVLDEAYMVRVLGGIRQYIDAFEFTKVFEILKELDKYQLPEAHQEAFAQINRYMEDLDIDQIYKILDEIQKI